MANLNENLSNPQWIEGIYQIETSDPVLGGENGIANRQAKELAGRTQFLKKKLDEAIDLIGTNKTKSEQEFASKNQLNDAVNQMVNLSGNQTIDGLKQFTNGLTVGTNLDLGIVGFDSERFRFAYQNYGSVSIGKDAILRFGNDEILNRSHIIDSLNHTAQNAPLSAAKGKELNDKLNEISVSGMVAFFASPNAPSGWLKCNGAAISRTVYDNLFAAIGTTFGSGDGRTTFNLPDLRGEFLRGLDDGRGVDSNRRMGSSQSDAVQEWNAKFTYQRAQVNRHEQVGGAIFLDGISATGLGETSGRFAVSHATIGPGVNRTARVSSETRPRNIALLACIKI